MPFGEILGKKSSQTIDITNKISVKDYGKPKILFSSLLLFYREKLKNESEKSNVTVTSRNATEEKREEKITKEIRKEENIREEENNGFREYKL